MSVEYYVQANHGSKVVYYMSDALFDTQQQSTVTAFKPGVRSTPQPHRPSLYVGSNKY